MPKKVVNIVDETSLTIKRYRTAMPPDTGMSDMAGVPRLVLRDITKLKPLLSVMKTQYGIGMQTGSSILSHVS